MDSTEKLTNVLNALKEAGVALTSVNIRQPSLDEVFFSLTALTGSAAKKEKEEN